MSKKEDDLIKKVTNAHLTDRFVQELGYKAKVERIDVGSEYAEHLDQLRRVLGDIGENLQEVGIAEKAMEYRGSLSIHVYTGAATKSFQTVNLFNWHKLEHNLADAAIREMNRKLKLTQGKQRSGF
jgi:hypothetical protein